MLLHTLSIYMETNGMDVDSSEVNHITLFRAVVTAIEEQVHSESLGYFFSLESELIRGSYGMIQEVHLGNNLMRIYSEIEVLPKLVGAKPTPLLYLCYTCEESEGAI